MSADKVFHRKVVTSADAPAAGGPYSPGVLVNDTLYLSGSIGMEPATGNLVAGGVGPETEQALKNLGGLLKAAGIDFSNVVKVTVFLANIEDWPAMNAVYEKYFKRPFPARSAFAVKGLPKGAKVEIEAVAVVGKVVDD